jgi:hypothetical protein
MTTPKEPGRQNSVVRIGAAIQTTVLAVGATAVVGKFNPTLGYGALFLIFGGLCLAFYSLLTWLFIQHPADLKKKLPITGKELRRKREAFYRNLRK